MIKKDEHFGLGWSNKQAKRVFGDLEIESGTVEGRIPFSLQFLQKVVSYPGKSYFYAYKKWDEKKKKKKKPNSRNTFSECGDLYRLFRLWLDHLTSKVPFPIL